MKCVPLAWILAVILISSVSAVPGPVSAQQEERVTQIYGCQRYSADVTHCDLYLNEIEGYQVEGTSTLIHPLTTGKTLFVDGKVAKALEMRAEYRESIEIANTPDLNPPQFSVSFWMKITKEEPYSHIVSHSNKGQNAGWLFDMFSSGNSTGQLSTTLRFGVFSSNGTIFSPKEVAIPAGDSAFVHIAGTFDGEILVTYMDGELVGQAEFSGDYTADPGVPLRIGSAAYCSSCNRWSGVIDELYMYDRTLSREEINQIYTMSAVTRDLVGQWKFDGDTSDSVGGQDGSSTTMLTSMAFAPDGRLFFTEKNSGEIRVMTPDNKLLKMPFASVNDVYASWEQGMLGIALDPEFQKNHFLYLYYTALIETENGEGGRVINRLVRFTDRDSSGADVKVLMDNIPASRGYHSGGALAFGTDGKLYVTVGDATEHIFAQDPAIVIGKVLRLNKDGTIPPDNPYPGSPVYAIGHRNMYGIAFDDDGVGLIAENGDFHYDEINLIIKGGNYGFPTLQPPNLPPERANNSAIKPLRSYWDAIAPTQMIYYDGDDIPELKGMYLFGTYTGDIYAIKLSEDKRTIVMEQAIDLAHFPFVPTISIAQDPDGRIYYGGYQIYRLDSISERQQNVHTVRVDIPSQLQISDLQVNQKKRELTIDASLMDSLPSDATITARIPRDLIDDITAITVESQDQQLGEQPAALDFEIDASHPDHNTVTIKLGGNLSGDLKLTIATSTVIPEFPAGIMAATAAMIFAVIATVTARKYW
ncbi:MAG: PQQ-dependent sugar dehydrogenase [Nitrososphaera sp.]|nr:PQQ-dependent sugar dehydrogenase [Nitrososphaera sp.]